MVRRHVDRTQFLDLDDPGIVADIDSPEDYRALTGAGRMKISPEWPARGSAAAVAIWLSAGLGAPYINANPYAERLRGSLSRALGRQVEFRQPVKFSLFNGPGFSVEDVVIHEDPAIGAEPIAYMDTIEIRPSIWSLLGGRFVVDSIGARRRAH